MNLRNPTRLRTAGQLLAELFPQRNGLIAGILTEVSGHTPRMAAPPDKSLFGLAFDFAVGLDLAAEQPYQAVFGSLDQSQADRLLRLAGRSPGTASALSDTLPCADRRRYPAHLFTAAAAAALVMDRVLRPSKPSTLEQAQTVVHMLVRHRVVLRAWAKEIWVARPAWSAYWKSYAYGFRDLLRSYGPVEAAPALLGGRRHADLIAGSTVVEVKTGRLDDRAYVDSAITQLLTYALLAMYDGRPVTHVGLYAARYELLVRYPIHDFLDELAGAPVDGMQAAARLAASIHASEPALPGVGVC